jgi:hypothetical protein
LAQDSPDTVVCHFWQIPPPNCLDTTPYARDGILIVLRPLFHSGRSRRHTGVH